VFSQIYMKQIQLEAISKLNSSVTDEKPHLKAQEPHESRLYYFKD